MSQFANSFRELEIWKLAIEIAKSAYDLANKLPQTEQYGLSQQIRRSAVSLSANIAEGFRRSHRKEFKQFLHIALGSAGELETYCELCRVLFNGSAPDPNRLLKQIDQFERMTNAMIQALKLKMKVKKT